MQLSCLVAVLVGLYVALDLATPLAPGPLVLGRDSSEEACQAERFRAHREPPPPLTVAPGAHTLLEPAAVPRPVSWAAPGAPELYAARSRLALQRPAPSADDD
jgi:hypothetical protein